MSEEFIPVTKPFIPNRKVLDQHLDAIWNREWFTNNGPVLQEYEAKLQSALDQEHLYVVGNGTIAIQIAIKALNLQGDILTTPFSYVATTSSIVWEGLNPVFVDIDETLNIDPEKIEASITPNTVAILATHCFGNACNIEAIQNLADKHGLKVIYDAAHCFGTKYKGKSVFGYGDISTGSLHATKLVHSIEGGLIVSRDEATHEKVRFLRNFGHNGPESFSGVGINGKNSELHAAVGLTVLEEASEILASRKRQCKLYDDLFSDAPLTRPLVLPDCEPNYSYYPVIFESEAQALRTLNALAAVNIHARRYFHPSLNTLDYVDHTEMPYAQRVSSSILCLPVYHTLTESNQEKVARVILESLRTS